MTKHTQGPWSVDGHDLTSVIAGGPNHWRHIARCEFGYQAHHEPYFEMDKANARLIAAAPELLEALEDIIENCYFEKKDTNSTRNINEFRAKARAVIAKARREAELAA